MPNQSLLFSFKSPEIEDGIPRSTVLTIPMVNAILEEGYALDQQSQNNIIPVRNAEPTRRSSMYVTRPLDGTSAANEFSKKFELLGVKGEDTPASQDSIHQFDTRTFVLYEGGCVDTKQAFGINVAAGHDLYTITKEFVLEDENITNADGQASLVKTEKKHYALQVIPFSNKINSPNVVTVTNEQFVDAMATGDFQCLNTPSARDSGYIAYRTIVEMVKYKREIVNDKLVVTEERNPENRICVNLFQLGSVSKIGKVYQPASAGSSLKSVNEAIRNHDALDSLRACKIVLDPKLL